MTTFMDVKYLGNAQNGEQRHLWIEDTDGITTVYLREGRSRLDIGSFTNLFEGINLFVEKFKELCEPEIYENHIRK